RTRSRCRVKPWRGCRPGRSGRCGRSCRNWRRGRCRRSAWRGSWCGTELDFKGAFVDAAVYDAIESGATLIKERRRSKLGVAGPDGWPAGKQRVRECGTAIVLQWPEQRISIDLIAWTNQIPAPIIIAEVIPAGGERAAVVNDVGARLASF